MTIAGKVFEKLEAAPPEVAQQVLDYPEKLERNARRAPPKPCASDSWAEFRGVMKDFPGFQGDPVEIQRKLRDDCGAFPGRH